jgi:hypothetical protein
MVCVSVGLLGHDVPVVILSDANPACPGAPLGVEDGLAAVRKLGLVWSEFAACAPAILAFVERFTASVVLQATDNADALGSWSSDEYVGRTVLMNAHRPGATTGLLAEMLVHEAIHSCVYMVELEEPLLKDRALVRSSARIPSPWSGNSLTVNSFVSACFVWFGLTQLWTTIQSSGGFWPDGPSRRHVAQRGFDGPSLMVLLAPYVDGISPEALVAIEAMQAAVQATLVTVPTNR